jgi:hypothetical protein
MQGRYFRFERSDFFPYASLRLFDHWYGGIEVGFEYIDSYHFKLLLPGEKRIHQIIDGREVAILKPLSPEIESLIEKMQKDNFLLYLDGKTAACLWLEGLLQEETFKDAIEEEEKIVLPFSIKGRQGKIVILKEGVEGFSLGPKSS